MKTLKVITKYAVYNKTYKKYLNRNNKFVFDIKKAALYTYKEIAKEHLRIVEELYKDCKFEIKDIVMNLIIK